MKPGYGLFLDVKSSGYIGQKLSFEPCIPVASSPRAQAAAVTGDWAAVQVLVPKRWWSEFANVHTMTFLLLPL